MAQWQWQTPEQRELMLSRRLNPQCMADVAWEPLPGETPDVHFARCQRVFVDSKAGADV